MSRCTKLLDQMAALLIPQLEILRERLSIDRGSLRMETTAQFAMDLLQAAEQQPGGLARLDTELARLQSNETLASAWHATPPSVGANGDLVVGQKTSGDTFILINTGRMTGVAVGQGTVATVHGSIMPPQATEAISKYRAAFAARLSHRTAGGGLIPRMHIDKVRVPVPRDGPPDSDLLKRVLTSEPPVLLELLGNVGSGKTELLCWLAAEVNRQTSKESVPVLLQARDIDRLGPVGALHDVLRRFSPEPALIAKAARPWHVFIDALDEAGPKGADGARALIDYLGSSAQSVIVATRHTVRLGHSNAETIRLQPWTEVELKQFLELWRHQDSDAVEALEDFRKRSKLGGLLSSPLMATLCLLPSQTKALRSRTAVLESAIRKLFQRWVEIKKDPNKRSPTWQEVAPILRRLAFEVVSEKQSFVSRDEIERFVGEIAPDREVELSDALVLDLGVLVERHGGFEFALRPIAEFLAAQHLSKLSTNDVLNTANAAWGLEVIRHLAGLYADHDPTKAVELLGLLLRDEDEDQPGFSNWHLRAVLASIAIATDIGDTAAPVTEPLALACLHRMLDEESVWVGERVADAVRALAAADSPVWRALQAVLLTVVSDSRTNPALWFKAQNFSAEEWSELLFYRDPAVRAVATRKLAPQAHDAQIRNCLISSLQDESWAVGSFEMPPAFEAGIALRQSRDEGIIEIAKYLLRQKHAQLPGYAAAFILRTGEAPAEDLVKALREAAKFGRYPVQVIEELETSAEGSSALKELWPNWRAELNALAPYTPKEVGGPQPPVSTFVRARLLRVLIASRNAVSTALEALLRAGGEQWVLEAACQFAYEAPDAAIELLNRIDRGAPLKISSENLLAHAAVRHADVRDALLSLWGRLNETHSQLFPGRALEGLVALGDSEAIKVYAAWLPNSLGAKGPFEIPPPSADVFRGAVLEAARTLCLKCLHQATKGWTDEQGKHVTLSRLTAGSILGRYSPAWIGDVQIMRQVMKPLSEWLDSKEPETFRAALYALPASVDHIDKKIRKKVVTRLKSVITENAKNAMFESFELPIIIRELGRLRLTSEAQKLLRELVSRRSPAACHAGVILAEAFHEEAAELSQEVATLAWRGGPLENIEPELLTDLVRAAPTEWAHSLCEALAKNYRIETHAALAVLRALPAKLKLQVAKEWFRQRGQHEFPWVNEGPPSFECVRPADRARQIVFDAGIELSPS